MFVDKVAFEHAMQRFHSQPIGLERFIGHVEIAGQRLADLGCCHLELGHHHLLDRVPPGAGELPTLLERLGGQGATQDQPVVLGGPPAQAE